MQYKKKYDVVIVGAGPGGLRCAEILGKTKSVLLVEKNKTIGPKVCAGGLTRKAIKYLRGIGMPKEIVENSFTSILFRKGKLKTLINFGEEFIYTIEREKLGQWQLGRLQKMENVEVSAGTRVTSIEKDFVILDDSRKVEYDFLVGADGSSSIVRKFLGIATERWGVAYHYMVPFSQKEFKNIEIIFDSKSFYAWYAWIFPYAKSASIGTGYAPRAMSGEKSREGFENWATSEKISLENLAIAAQPINCDYRGYNFGNTFLVGDAAGVASGFTGEGIYQALVFGDEVAQIILGKQTQSAKIKEVLREKNIHELMLRLVVFAGPFRDLVFSVVVLGVKIPWCGRILLRILS